MDEILKQAILGIYEELKKDESIATFFEEKGITAEIFLEKTHDAKFAKQIVGPKGKMEKEPITLELLKELISNSYNDNWTEKDNRCVFFYSSVVPLGMRPFTMCAERCKGIFCDKHEAKKNDKLLDNYKRGKFDREEYHLSAISKRKGFARTKLKAMGANIQDLKTISKKRMLSTKDYPFTIGYKRDVDNGLVLKPISDELTRVYYTVGIDRKNDGKMRKLKITDIHRYEDTNVTFDIESLDDEAKEYLLSLK